VQLIFPFAKRAQYVQLNLPFVMTAAEWLDSELSKHGWVRTSPWLPEPETVLPSIY